MNKKKWLILDRDGVINHDSDAFIKSPAEWQALPGSLEAIAELTRAGYGIVVVSNQSGIARQLFTIGTLAEINEKMLSGAKTHGGKIERVFFCPHGPDDHCHCRKPLAGLFFEAAEAFAFNLEHTYAIGDSVRDLEAALTAGAMPVLVETGKGPRSLSAIKALEKNHVLHTVPKFKNLRHFTDWLLNTDD